MWLIWLVHPRREEKHALYQQVGIVGVGLIGASIGRALKEKHLTKRVIGIGRSASSLAQALLVNSIDEAHTRIGPEIADVDLLIICTPVPLVVDAVDRAWTILRPDALITDVSSTKSTIMAEIERRRPKDRPVAEFVGSHPMAGSHRRGPEASRPDLFENHTCIIMNSTSATPHAREKVKAFWRALGMRLEEMSPQEHDESVARISHVPHLVSYALALSARERDLKVAGPGFRDTTRLGGSPPALWREIVRENRSAVLDGLDGYLAELKQLREMIEKEDWPGLENRLTDANQCVERLGSVASSKST